MPLFSVIIPAYNRADLIAQTLDSVFAQRLNDIEVIVVDDGSTDGTLDVVAGYGDRVRVLKQANKGPGAARNAGLRVATANYVAFLDSDDVWFPWTTETYAKVIEQHDRPAFVAGKPFIFHSPTELRSDATPGELQTLVFADYFTSGDEWRWYSASSFVMRRDALLAVGGFTDEWVNGEDADAAMRMGAAGAFAQILSPFTFGYRKHPGSAMSDLMRSFKGIRRLITEESAGKFPGGPARSRERTRIITSMTRPLAIGLLDTRDRAAAWELYRLTFGWHVSLGRVKFLAGFPGKAFVTKLRSRQPQPSSTTS